MRRSFAVLLVGILLVAAFGLLAAPEKPSPPALRDIGYGPHLMIPNPDTFPRAPFTQPADWTGVPPGTRGGGGTRATGTVDVLVLLVEFTGTTASKSVTEVRAVMNEMQAYYAETSYNLLTVQSTVAPWVRTLSSMTEYGADSATRYDDANGPVYRLVTEAVRLADLAGMDFSAFDGDGDNVVDHLVVVHAGGAQEATGMSNDIWSHRWSVIDANPSIPGDQRLTVDGVQVFGYLMVSEDSPVGVFAHEFGHDLGLPDLYDTDGSSEGVGVWDIMGTGSWNGVPRGTSPAHFGAWAKVQLDWITPTTVTSPLLGQSILRAETNAIAFKLPIATTGTEEEYFLIENRQETGYDTGLPGSGILIWHVDETVSGNDNDARRLVDLEEADGNDRPVQSTDPWADSENGFGPDTDPNSNSNLNQRTGWKVRRIGASGPTMVADISREIDDDLAVTDVRAPCCVPVSSSASVEVVVENHGARLQQNFEVNLSVYLGAYEPGSSVCCTPQTVASLAKGDVETLTWTVSAGVVGKFVLEASIEFAADEIPENNYRFAHFNAATNYFWDDVDPPEPGWTQNAAPGDPALWEVVWDWNGTVSHSPQRAYLFHRYEGNVTCVPTCPTEFNMTSRPINVPAGPAYLYFWHHYDLRGRGFDNDSATLETDVGHVNVTVGGILRSSTEFRGAQADWEPLLVNLSAWTSGGATVYVQFSATAGVLQTAGGWWVDDIAIANAPLRRGLAARAVRSTVVAEPGSMAEFRIKVANVGDFDDEVAFDLEGSDVWPATIGLNETDSISYDTFRTQIPADEEATLFLTFLLPQSAVRGSRNVVYVTATSLNDPQISSTFETTTVVNDPFGLAGLERYLILFLVVFAIIIVISVVIDSVKKQRGVYRRW